MFICKLSAKSRHKLQLYSVGLKWKIALLMCIMNAPLVFSQNCDSTLIVNENSPYRYRSFKNRCEGFYAVPVSRSEQIELIGLTRGKFYFLSDSNEVITLSSPRNKNAPMQVRAQTVALKSYYRMDTKLLPGDSILWPVKDVLFHNWLTPEKLRVTAWNEVNGKRNYLPIETRSKLKKTLPTRDVYLTFRPSVNVENIQYAVYNYQNKQTTDWIQHKNQQCRSGMPVNLVLKLDSGIYRISIAALVAGSNDEWIECKVDINN